MLTQRWDVQQLKSKNLLSEVKKTEAVDISKNNIDLW